MTKCIDCPDGFYCPLPDSIPILCPLGYYTEGSKQTSCKRCPAGSYCPGTRSSSRKQVPAGFYSNEGMTYYLPCQPGFKCAATGVSVPCELGKYLPNDGGDCTSCPAGKACPTIMQNHMHDCPEGTYSLGGATYCEVCPGGHECQGRNSRKSCGIGYFSRPGSESCTKCPAGYYCPYNNAPHALPCPPGSFSGEGKAVCEVCPQGTACGSRIKQESCASKQLALKGSHVCLECPGGLSCTGGASAPCPVGEYAVASNSTCKPCPEGSYCPNGMTYPIPCPPGHYGDVIRLQLCKVCALGQYSIEGSEICTDCPAGKYCPAPHITPRTCPAATFSTAKAHTCTPCTPGKYCPEGSISDTQSCPTGHYCNYVASIGFGGIGKIPCPAGTYRDTEGAKSMSECTKCTAGNYCPEGTITPIICPKGHICPEGSKYAFDYPCPSGTYKNTEGGSGVCHDCTIGNYCPTACVQPMKCPPGYYCPAKTGYLTNNLLMPAGTYTGIMIIHSAPSSGIDCPKGAYCPVGSVFPILCPPGTYNPDIKQETKAACKPCDSGSVCIKYGNTAESNIKCPAGYYCPKGSTSFYDYPCPAGTQNNIPSGKSIDDCKPCPPGFGCSEATNDDTNRKQRCSPGYYCPKGSTTTKFIPCPAGRFSNKYENKEEKDCDSDCEEGYYCLEGSDRLTGECHEGYYCPKNSKSPTEKPCPKGTYSNFRGLSNPDQCTACPPGYYCPKASTHPLPCPKGSYRDKPNGEKSTDCVICTQGYKCPYLGTANKIPCGPGMYSPPGVTECFLCIPGYDCSGETTGDITKIDGGNCGQGYYCVRGKAPGVSNKIICPAGSFCTAKSSWYKECPSGTTSIEGQAECTKLPAGDYAKFGASKATGPCLPGYYCLDGSWNEHAKACPLGTHNPNYGAKSELDCKKCPRGSYCLEGTGVPLRCPHGYYCPSGTSRPKKCPIGTYGPDYDLKSVNGCLPCPSGMYCSLPGLPAPEGLCDAGFFCTLGAKSSTPRDGTTGNLCPEGGFCEAGSRRAKNCPPGRYNPDKGGRDLEACILCPPGKYCFSGVNPEPDGDCKEGYYCPPGSYMKDMRPAPPGFYTKEGAATVTPCPEGTYNLYYAQSKCTPCPPGFLCIGEANFEVFIDCPKGKYCEEGSSIAKPCPTRTYNPNENARGIKDCIPCPPGKFCSNEGLIQPGDGVSNDDECSPGYFCRESSDSRAPEELTKNSGPCQEGHYCPKGSSGQLPCPPGTYSDQKLRTKVEDCKACTPGYYCMSSGLSAPTGECDEGYYCPPRSILPRTTELLCPKGSFCPKGSSTYISCWAGTYQDEQGQSSCKECPKGFYCGQNQHTLEGKECPVGHYCPPGTVSPTAFPCPIGRYNPLTHAHSLDQCIYCDPGHACEGTGRHDTSGPCNEGFYCSFASPTKTPPSRENGALTGHGSFCTAGHYCPEGSSHPIKCPGGYYCSRDRLRFHEGKCEAGYYCRLGATSKTPTGLEQQGGDLCPAGYYCPEGSDSPTPCPPGTYNQNTGSTNLADCRICDNGRFCKDAGLRAVTGPCEKGYYCKVDPSMKVGFTTPTPAKNICPKGYYCPQGTIDKIPCSNEYQDLIGQAECKPCPGGYHCTAVSKALCKPREEKLSYYCPANVMGKVNCQRGTYNVKDKSDSIEDCILCPPGHYCPVSNSEEKIVPCAEGYYCRTKGAIDKTGNGKCPPGYYCPVGTENPVPCPKGKYCEREGLTPADIALAIRNCAAGYFCDSESTSPRPLGSECKAGYYCPEGTKAPIACPIGTYRSSPGGTSKSSCTPCDVGRICPSRGLTSSRELCNAGYYCPGSTPGTRPEIPCPVGAQCRTGSSSFEICPDRTYQNAPMQAYCNDCPERYHCQNLGTLAGATRPRICPKGHYCPARTSTPIPCRISTFSSRTGLASETECDSCTPGYYCEGTGLTEPSGKCDPGYFCTGGSRRAKPKDSTGNICSKGHYCPLGSVAPIPCPPGTFSDALGLQDSSECRLCIPGRFCPLRGATSMDLRFGTNEYRCLAGYVCFVGAAIPNPTDGIKGKICDEGRYCPAGTTEEIKCSRGTYNPDKGQAACIECPEGNVCGSEEMTKPAPCGAGRYCPAGSHTGRLCPMGTYSPLVNLRSRNECLDCDPGHYCPHEGMNQVGPKCVEGFVCPRRSTTTSANSVYSFALNNPGRCPAGYICPEGSAAPTPCPIGTFKRGQGIGICEPCERGRYCDELALANPRKPCAAGHLCIQGATHARPVSLIQEGGELCPPGHYCPEGAREAQRCSKGTYEPRQGSTACQICPAGYVCDVGCITPQPCNPGHYCPRGRSEGIVCPDGTFGRVGNDRLERADQCTPCPSGSYCKGGVVAGECKEGYYCDVGATKEEDVTKRCPIGHYCSKGAKLPTKCPDGTFNTQVGAYDITYCIPCTDGFYCLSGSPIPIPCPIGHYCIPPASKPTLCPIGTYQPRSTQVGREYDPITNPGDPATYAAVDIDGVNIVTPCLYCPAGAYCYDEGIFDPTMYPCPVGHYCEATTESTIGSYSPTPCPAGSYRNTEGAKNSNECLPCPGGHYCTYGNAVHPQPCRGGSYCPPGSADEILCPIRKYCPPKTEVPIPCPEAYYCDPGSEIYIKCQNGFYCPAEVNLPTASPNCTTDLNTDYPCPNVVLPIPCPAGYVGSNNDYNIDIDTGCSICTPGYYSLVIEGQAKCMACTQGYVCLGGTTTDRPVDIDIDGGHECPEGYYCPAGTYIPIPCPRGTYSTGLRKVSIRDCHPCPDDTFNPDLAATSCMKCGASAIPSPDKTTCLCKGDNRAYQVESGTCLCKPQYEPVDGTQKGSTDEDCQPLIFDRCRNDEVRDSHGNCRDKFECSECPDGEGVMSAGIGICECKKVDVLDSICDEKCRDNSLQLSVNYDGDITVVDPTDPSVIHTIKVSSIPNMFGSISYSSADSKLVSIQLDSIRGFAANYQPPKVLLDISGLRRRLESGRLLGSTEDDAIKSPAICINSGDTLFFAITPTDYPVYDKDNLLNSNPYFDYGLFLDLARNLNNGANIENFAFTFSQPGIYVFSNNANPNQITIIGVMGDNLKCSDEYRYIQPITTSSLLKLGLSQTEDIILKPDWPLIFGLIISIIIIVPLLVWFMQRFINSPWLKKKDEEVKYHQLNKTASYEDFVAKGKTWKRDMLGAGAGEGESGDNLIIEADDEKIGDPNEKETEIIEMRKKENEVGVHEISPEIFSELYKELQDHAKFVKDEFAKKAGMDSENIRKVFDEVEMLRRLMQQKLQNIARSYGKGIRLLFDDNPDNDKVSVDEEGVEEEKKGDNLALESDEEKEKKDKEIEFNHDIFNDMDERDQEDVEEIAEDIRQAHIATQKELSYEENNARKAFELELQSNTNLTPEEKKSLLEDYDKANAKLNKLLMVEGQNSENRLQQVLEQRRRARRKMQEEVKELEQKKQQIQNEADAKLKEIATQSDIINRDVDMEINKERDEEIKKIDGKKEQELKKMKDKFQKKLKDNLSTNERAEILDDFNKKMQALEKELEEEKKEDVQKLNITLDMKKQKRKGEREIDLKQKEKKIKEEKAKRLKELEKKIQVLNENLENEQIEGAIRSIQEEERHNLEQEKLTKQLKDNREKEEEIARLKDKELKAQREALIMEEDKEINHIHKLNEEVEAKLNKDIIQVRNKKAELNAKLAKTTNPLEKKALLEEFKLYQEEVAGEVRNELEKQNEILVNKIGERKRLRAVKEAEIRKQKKKELDDLRKQNQRDEEELKRNINDQKLKRQIEVMQQKLIPEELPFAVKRLIDENQLEELSDLLKRQFNDKARILKENMQILIKEKTDAVEKVKEEQELQMNNAKKFADKGLMSKEDYEAKLKELEESKNSKLKRIEYDYAQKQAELEEQKLMEIERANSDEMVEFMNDQAIRKQQYMDEFASNDFIKKLLAGDKEDIEKEMEEYKKEIEESFAQKRQMIDEKRKKIENILLNDDKKIQELEMKAKKLLKDQEKIDKKREEKNKKIIQDKLASKEEELKHTGITDEEKKKILEEHQKELDKLLAELEKERIRQRENSALKTQEKLKQKEELQKQREEQLALLRKEEEKILDQKVKEIQKERGIETEEQKGKLAELTKKYDAMKEVFDKMKPLSGVDLEEVKEEENVLRGIIDFKKGTAKDYSKIDLSFELLFDRVTRLMGSVKIFTGLQFEQILSGYLDLNSKFEAISSGNIPKAKTGA